MHTLKWIIELQESVRNINCATDGDVRYRCNLLSGERSKGMDRGKSRNANRMCRGNSGADHRTGLLRRRAPKSAS